MTPARPQLFELYPVGEDEVTRKRCVSSRLRCRVARDGPWICFKEELHLQFQLQRGGGAQLSSSAMRRRQRESDTTPREVGRRLRCALARIPTSYGHCKIRRRHPRITDIGRLVGTLGLAGSPAGDGRSLYSC
ncbi:hypothetical protein GQ55_3G483900 [Panicum hallii var. hallii]|uniref:Uncharacterized protein n=1 Tax=Panicum hallii var. hallii TaxID=1504633 RepID=A0A2T7EJR4_9POAL|nr:hypothetical protein GQ55_3G483900 [Panicum hallii var. hallii]